MKHAQHEALKKESAGIASASSIPDQESTSIKATPSPSVCVDATGVSSSHQPKVPHDSKPVKKDKIVPVSGESAANVSVTDVITESTNSAPKPSLHGTATADFPQMCWTESDQSRVAKDSPKSNDNMDTCEGRCSSTVKPRQVLVQPAHVSSQSSADKPAEQAPRSSAVVVPVLSAEQQNLRSKAEQASGETVMIRLSRVLLPVF